MSASLDNIAIALDRDIDRIAGGGLVINVRTEAGTELITANASDFVEETICRELGFDLGTMDLLLGGFQRVIPGTSFEESGVEDGATINAVIRVCELFGPSGAGSIKASSEYRRRNWKDGHAECARQLKSFVKSRSCSEWSANGHSGWLQVKFDAPATITKIEAKFGCSSRWRIDLLTVDGRWLEGVNGPSNNDKFTLKKGGNVSLDADDLREHSGTLFEGLRLQVGNNKKYPGEKTVDKWYCTVKQLAVFGIHRLH